MATKIMVGVTLPQDVDSSKIQILEATEATTAAISASATTARAAIPAGSTIVEVASSGICHWTFGNSAVTAATTNKILNGMGTYVVPSGVTHVAVVTTTGVASAIFTITKLT